MIPLTHNHHDRQKFSRADFKALTDQVIHFDNVDPSAVCNLEECPSVQIRFGLSKNNFG